MSSVIELHFNSHFYLPSLGYNTASLLEFVKKFLKNSSINYNSIDILTDFVNRQVFVEVR